MTLMTLRVWAVIDDHCNDVASGGTGSGKCALSTLAFEFHAAPAVSAPVIVSINVQGDEMSGRLSTGRHMETASSA